MVYAPRETSTIEQGASAFRPRRDAGPTPPLESPLGQRTLRKRSVLFAAAPTEGSPHTPAGTVVPPVPWRHRQTR